MHRLAIIALVVAVMWVAGCAHVQDASSPRQEVNHLVLIWLKEPGNATHRARIIEISRTFKEIPGVVSVSVGEAIPSDRKIVDDSFDVAIHMIFASTKDMNRYIDHPKHKQAVRDVLLPITDKIVVYDFSDASE